MTNIEARKIIQLIDAKISKALRDVHTTALGKIISYDATTMRAEVQLLESIEFNGEHYASPIIPNCLVSYERTGDFYIRIPYKVGDKVVVGFCESSIDNVSYYGQAQNQSVYRRHSEDDAIVLSGWRADIESKLSSDNIGDYLIYNTANNSKIVFKADGVVEINNGTSVVIGTDGTITTNATTINATNATITCTEAEIGGIPFTTHTHLYTHVSPDDGTTKPPQ
jgi:hypothetical protein